tara:strand:- start:627 stop:2195 length:1569 start_codon:yes stop_codon:yes gene_type:complete
MKKTNSHFTDLMITKDVHDNADFIFGVDMDRMVIDNSAYSALIEDMTDVAKRQVAANSEILSFSINRRQVKKELSLNSLGSPQMPEVFSNETISHQVIGSAGEMSEVPLIVPGQTSGIKYLTASDIGLSRQTAGTYQYELSISFVDGFIPTIRNMLKKLYRTSDDVSIYLSLLGIPKSNYLKKKGSKISIKKSTTDRMSKTYVDALSYFKNLKNIDTEYKRASSLVASRGATKESIETFQKRLNAVVNKIERLISKTGTAVSPSSATNEAANSGFSNASIVEIKQSFNNTISVENVDDRYVDYFKGKGKIGGGLNIYSSTEVKNSTPETIYSECAVTPLEMLQSRGVSLFVSPSSEDIVCETDKKETMKTEKYIGLSAVSTGGLLKGDLSPIDLSTVSIGSLVKTIDINAAVSSMASKLTSVSTFEYAVDNITKIATDPVVASCALDDAPVMSSPILTADMSKTMVLVATQASSCSTSEPMLKYPEWKPLEEVSIKKDDIVLCMQHGGQLDVANGFFLMETK